MSRGTNSRTRSSLVNSADGTQKSSAEKRARRSSTACGWSAATRMAELAGAPVPEHVVELMQRGRTADGSRIADALGLDDFRTTQEVCTELYEWATVTPIDRMEAVA